MQTYVREIAEQTGIGTESVAQTLALLASGATIPFIARYRKEMTGSLDEVKIAAIRDANARLEELNKRRQAILSSIGEQGLLNDALRRKIGEATSLSVLEDLYLPYRPKRKTRASIAVSRGLEPLARYIMSQPGGEPALEARAFVDPQREVPSVEEALSGARDIIAEWINEDGRARERLRRLMERSAGIHSKAAKGKEEEGMKYKSWFDWTEPASRAASHRVLAIFRGEAEGFLKVSIRPDEDQAHEILERLFVKREGPCAQQLRLSLKDAWKRLLQPSLETELRNKLKEKADKKAIAIFGENLRQLLLAPPLGQKRIMAIDPGFRTGCKLVCLNEEGRLLHNETIYPHPPQGQKKAAMSKIQGLVETFRVEAIAMGNGTAGRETEEMVRRIRFNSDVTAVMVNESGASVYSASQVAREEFPGYDVTVRGAVSIGRRLADPLSELVKIEPRSIGVGQYQHDVDQKQLKQALDDVVESCVNAVGVEANTASKELLAYVSGIGPALAAAIVDYRNNKGALLSREDLLKVPRLGPRAFEQSAGFIRVACSENPLDRSAVHPESYELVEEMARDLQVSVPELLQDKSLRQKIRPEQYVRANKGLPTIRDILQELERPGRDPRKSFTSLSFSKDINRMEDLREGMVLPGIVTNITAFGAFVDIGVHQDGLVHVSEMADRFVRDPAQVVRLNQGVQVKVLSVDIPAKRIGLSMKQA